MGGFAALLIGASDYELDGCTSLPFIPGDLERLDGALGERGFRVVRPRSGRQISANFVNGEVGHFLRAARRGETLLICLSGHGLHAEGKDYLIPEDLHSGVEPPWSGCIAIDWRSEVERTPAAQVLFLIDACRNGVRQDFMSGTVGWATREALVVAGRKVAHLYACSPGEYALFVGPDERRPERDSFSLFSRAVLDTLLEHDGPLNLEELRVATQLRIQAFHERYRKKGRPQRVRVLTDVDHTDFLVAGPPRGRATDPALPRPFTAEAGEAGEAGPTSPTSPTSPTGTAREPSRKPAPTDPRLLLALAVHQVQTSGRTEYLEECAAVGPVDHVLELGSRLAYEGAVAAALWNAAGRRRSPAALMDLVAALCVRGPAGAAHRVLDSAAADRPPGELLLALDAAALPPGEAGPLRATVLRAAARLPADAMAAGLTGLKRAGLDADARWLVGAPRPVADLPPLLAALNAAGLAAEADRLVREAIARHGARVADGLIGVLSVTGRTEQRAAALTLVAAGPLDGLVEWLAAERARAGREEEAGFVLREAVAARPDRYDLPAALRRGGQDGYLGTVHGEFARLAAPELHVALERWSADGADEDAEAVLSRLLRPFDPGAAAALAVRLVERGPSALLPPLLTEVCGQGATPVAGFLRHAAKNPALVGATVSAVADRYPVARLPGLIESLGRDGLRTVAADVWTLWAADRPAADLISVLVAARPADQRALLRRLRVARRSPEGLAELLDLARGKERRGPLGDRLAEELATGWDGETLVGVLVALRDRGAGLAEDELLQHVSEGGGIDGPARIAHWLASEGRRERARSLLSTWAATGRDLPGVAALTRCVLAVGDPELGRRLLADALGGLSAADLIVVAETADPSTPEWDPEPEQAPVRWPGAVGNGELLLGVAERRSPAEVADLLVALDHHVPTVRLPTDVTALLGGFLMVRPTDDVGALVRELDARRTAEGPGERLAQAVRHHAAALFRAARATGGGAGAGYVPAVFRGGRPVSVPAVLDLFGELERAGSLLTAGLLVHRLGRFQPPAVVAELLDAFRDTSAFEVLCDVLAERPAEEAAEILSAAGEPGSAGTACAERLAGTVSADWWPAVLVELLAAGRSRAVGLVLAAAPWAERADGLVGLLDAVHRLGGEHGRAVTEFLALGLSPSRAMVVLGHVRLDGGTVAATPVLSMIARSPAAAAVWTELHERGWFEEAAGLLDAAPPDTDVLPWFRQLDEANPQVDRPELLRAAGADGRPAVLAARAGAGRAAPIATVLHRSPQEAAELLLAPGGLRDGLPEGSGPRAPAVRTELWRLLAAVRPAGELAVILAELVLGSGDADADGIAGRLLADESADRIAGVLTTAPGAGQDVLPAAVVIAQAAYARGTVVDLVGRLAPVPYLPGAARLVEALLVPAREGARIAEVTVGLIGADAPHPIRRWLVDEFCRRQRAEEVAALLFHLHRGGAGQDAVRGRAVVAASRPGELGVIGRALEDLGGRNPWFSGHRAARTAVDGAPAAPRRRFWRKDTNGP
ncbi:hypothetical protein ACFCX4_31545 [Kitasatospora sp. NPDC056327]|uniref:hypothetical protein n=1 Tax=Kitasatospora sp. NPDC056327 TaxID=3345785 RepID=UPI0035DBD4E5